MGMGCCRWGWGVVDGDGVLTDRWDVVLYAADGWIVVGYGWLWLTLRCLAQYLMTKASCLRRGSIAE